MEKDRENINKTNESPQELCGVNLTFSMTENCTGRWAALLMFEVITSAGAAIKIHSDWFPTSQLICLRTSSLESSL